MSELGCKLRAARTRAGLSQTGLGKALGVGKSAISHWELGTRRPDNDVIRAIAQICFADPAELLEIEDVLREVRQEPLAADEVKLVHTYRKLSQRQRENLQKLLDASVWVRREIEHPA